MEINWKELEDLKDELEILGDDEVLSILKDGEERFVVLTKAHFDEIRDLAVMIEEARKNPIQVFPEDFEISYEEYEAVKEQIIDALEKTLLPKPEKLN
ncbi:MAG: hypothetical protein IIZ47_00680 [Erysipelotrichaceae bacterium]|nr:hypothetical protein [Erysipelotrichaceae bacterium]